MKKKEHMRGTELLEVIHKDRKANRVLEKYIDTQSPYSILFIAKLKNSELISLFKWKKIQRILMAALTWILNIFSSVYIYTFWCVMTARDNNALWEAYYPLFKKSRWNYLYTHTTWGHTLLVAVSLLVFIASVQITILTGKRTLEIKDEIKLIEWSISTRTEA